MVAPRCVWWPYIYYIYKYKMSSYRSSTAKRNPLRSTPNETCHSTVNSAAESIYTYSVQRAKEWKKKVAGTISFALNYVRAANLSRLSVPRRHTMALRHGWFLIFFHLQKSRWHSGKKFLLLLCVYII